MTRQGDEPNHADADDDYLLDRLYVPDGNGPGDVESAGESAPADAPAPATDAASTSADSEPEGRAVLGVSRRRLLQTVGAVGTVGVLGGVGTAALLSDEEPFPTAFASGNFDLSLFCPTDESCTVGDNRVQIDVSGIRPGDAGDATIGVVLDDNPGWLWLGGPCAGGKLDRVLEVSLSLCTTQDCSDGGTTIASGTLADVLDDLASGVRVGDACLPAKEERYVNVEWSFPSGVEKPQQYKNETAAFDLEFYAQQCRHDDAPANPVPVRDCDDGLKRHAISFVAVFVRDDGTCRFLGKHDFKSEYIDTGSYQLGDSYRLNVTETADNGEGGETVGVQFDVEHLEGPDPELCKVVVKGGSRETGFTDTGAHQVDNPCRNGGCLTYSDEALFDGNATTELLYAPVNTKGGNQ